MCIVAKISSIRLQNKYINCQVLERMESYLSVLFLDKKY